MPASERTSCIPLSPANLLSLALRNTGRHGLRATANIVGTAVAVAALVFFLSFYRGTYEGVMFSAVIDYSTSHGQFMRPGFDDDDPDVWLEPGNLFDERTVGSLPGEVETAAPRLMGPAFAGDGSRKVPVTLAGVDFAAETAVMDVDSRLVSGSFGGDGGVVIGKKLAESLGLSAGDEIRVQATTVDGAPNLDYWKVAGIYSTGYPSMDRALVLMDLSQAQDFLAAPGLVNKAYCRLSGARDAVAREAAIARMGSPAARAKVGSLGLAFRDWKSYARSVVKDAKFDGIFYSIFIFILLFLSLATLAGTMRVTVFERKREIGMMRASGWLRKEIGRLFLFESAAIGFFGSVAGGLVGAAAALLLAAHPVGFGDSFANLDIPSFVLTCDLQTVDVLLGVAGGFVTAVLAGIMPAANAARMPILSALAERQ